MNKDSYKNLMVELGWELRDFNWVFTLSKVVDGYGSMILTNDSSGWRVDYSHTNYESPVLAIRGEAEELLAYRPNTAILAHAGMMMEAEIIELSEIHVL